MSPEQARAKPVDKRTDIWAFGCCLYEALTARLPFQGETVSDTLAQVLERDPDWDRLPPDTPPQVRVLLRRCLKKDSSRRLRDIGDARLEVSDLITESGRAKAVPDAEAVSSRRLHLMPAAVVLGAVLGALIIASALVFRQGTDVSQPTLPSETLSVPIPQPKPVRRYSITLPDTHPVTPPNPLSTGPFPLALSPDGTLLVYVANVGGSTQLVKRPLDQLEAQPMPGTEGASNPFFSPDGQWIGFFADNELKKVPLRGRAVVTLCTAPAPPFGASWGDDELIVFSSGTSIPIPLRRVSADGGAVEIITTVDSGVGDLVHAFPHVLPGGKGLLFNAVSGTTTETMRLVALPPDGGAHMTLVEGAVCLGYLPTGHLLYGQETTLVIAPFNVDALEISGLAVPIAEVKLEIIPPFNLPTLFALSNEGLLVYAPGAQGHGGVSGERALVWVDREGNEELLATPSRAYKSVDLSPDGGHLAVGLSDEPDIWIFDLTREPVTQQRLTFGLQSTLRYSTWSPDGQRVVFNALRDGTWSLSWKAANGTGSIESLYTSENAIYAYAWSPDGKFLLFVEQSSSSGYDIWTLSLEGEINARPLMAESYNEDGSAISPDGRWIAYMSDESGQIEIYVRPFPNVDDGKWLISAQGGVWHPVWAPDGGELYYYAPARSQMMAVSVETEPSFAAGDPEVLIEGHYFISAGGFYDISPDGQRFLMIKEGEQAGEADKATEPAPITELIVVENWFEELKRLSPVAETP